MPPSMTESLGVSKRLTVYKEKTEMTNNYDKLLYCLSKTNVSQC